MVNNIDSKNVSNTITTKEMIVIVARTNIIAAQMVTLLVAYVLMKIERANLLIDLKIRIFRRRICCNGENNLSNKQ